MPRAMPCLSIKLSMTGEVKRYARANAPNNAIGPVSNFGFSLCHWATIDRTDSCSSSRIDSCLWVDFRDVAALRAFGNAKAFDGFDFFVRDIFILSKCIKGRHPSTCGYHLSIGMSFYNIFSRLLHRKQCLGSG